MVRLGNRLRTARRHAGLTQAEAAQVVGTTAQTVRNWETARNEPPMSAIRKLAERYSVSEDSLLDNLTTPFAPSATRLGFRYGRVIVDGQKLSEARAEAGLTQDDVAEMTGLSISAIRRYERGISSPATRTLQTLASIFNKGAGWFTPQGYFTEDEQRRFDASTTFMSGQDSQADSVMVAYKIAKADLPDDAKQRIANFIIFTHRQVFSSRQYSVRIFGIHNHPALPADPSP